MKIVATLLLAVVLTGCNKNNVQPSPINLDRPASYKGKKEVYQEYSGSANRGEMSLQPDVKNYTRIEIREWGKNIVYDTDIGTMVMTMVRGGKHQDDTRQIPYGMCLDFINENLGKTSGGWRLVAIKCTQD